MVVCDHKHFSTYATSNVRQRHDYDSPDHLIAEMMHEEYWQPVINLISPRDLVHVTDAAGESLELRIDWTSPERRTVGFSVLRTIDERPMLPATGYTLKFRGNRNGQWCIIDAEGAIVKQGLKTEDEAHRHLDDMLKQKAA